MCFDHIDYFRQYHTFNPNFYIFYFLYFFFVHIREKQQLLKIDFTLVKQIIFDVDDMNHKP